MTVVWTNAGFPETVADGADWHKAIANAAGRPDAFPFVSHMRPTAQPGLVVRIAAGEMVSAGVWSNNDEIVNMPALPTLPSGQAKYHLLVVSKAYGATAGEHVTSYQYIAGDQNRVIPAYSKVRGELWETPIALVKVKGGSSTIDELVDLRVIAETPGVYTIYDDLALSLIDRPGAVAYNPNTGITQARVYTAGLNRAWLPLLTTTGGRKVVGDNSPGSNVAGWGEDGEWCQARSILDTRVVQLQVMLRHWSGGTLQASGSGSFADTLLYKVKTPYVPYDQVVGSGYYYSANRATYGCLVTLESNGEVYLRSGAPNIDLPQINGDSNVGKASIRASFTYLAKD